MTIYRFIPKGVLWEAYEGNTYLATFTSLREAKGYVAALIASPYVAGRMRGLDVASWGKAA